MTQNAPAKADPPIATQPVLKSKTGKIAIGAGVVAFIAMIPDIVKLINDNAHFLPKPWGDLLLKTAVILGMIATLYGRLATKQAANEGPQ